MADLGVAFAILFSFLTLGSTMQLFTILTYPLLLKKASIAL